MIESRYKYENDEKWYYKDFNSEEEAIKAFEKDIKTVVQYDFRPKQSSSNPLKNWWNNIRNTRKNWKKVKGSPYASLSLALKVRKILVGLLIPFIAFRIYDMVVHFRGSGVMVLFNKLFMIGIGVYICYVIYRTIPQSKKQMEYYKKYPHLINYCPTDTKETIDQIINKIEQNKKEVDNGTRTK